MVMSLTTAQAEGDLMFSAAEKEALKEAIALSPKAMSKPGEGAKNLRLDGIVYKDKTHWKVWISGHVYGPDAKPTWGKILAVEMDRVILKRDGKTVTLALGEVFS